MDATKPSVVFVNISSENMKPTWYRVSTSFDSNDQKTGSITVYFDYDLRCWMFGFTFERDLCWYDLKISFGPIGISFMYWRKHVHIFDPDLP